MSRQHWMQRWRRRCKRVVAQSNCRQQQQYRVLARQQQGADYPLIIQKWLVGVRTAAYSASLQLGRFRPSIGQQRRVVACLQQCADCRPQLASSERKQP